MEQKRSIRLILKTSDLTINSSTTVGTCDQYRVAFTWNNINLRLLMGDMYDQYDYFNLLLNTVSGSSASAGIGTTADDRFVYIKISGLPFINQAYQQATGNNGNICNITTFQLPSTTATSNQFYNNPSNVITFRKDQDLCNISISLNRVVDDTKAATTVAFPQFTFYFTIIGIDKADNPDKINYSLKLK